MDEQTPARRGRPPKITVAPRTPSAEDIIKARLRNDPFSRSEVHVPLRDPGQWAIKEANSYADENRHFSIVHREGWVPVTMDDIQAGVSPESFGYRLAEDGHTLCRGVRGEERLYKMPTQARQQIAMAKADANKAGTGNASKVKAELSNVAARQFGSEAGDFVHDGIRITGEDREGPLHG